MAATWLGHFLLWGCRSLTRGSENLSTLWQAATPTSITPPAGGYLTKAKATAIKPLTFLAYWSWCGRGLSVSCFLGDDTEFLLPDEPRTMTACCWTGHLLRHRGHKPGAGQRALPFFSALVMFQPSFHACWIAKGKWVPLSFISIIIVCEQLQLPRAAISCVRSHCRGSHCVFTFEIPTQMGDSRDPLKLQNDPQDSHNFF